MVTKLDGPATVFLPFNQGDHGAAGNPVNPNGGHRTAYLWEQVWARESWLEILGRYLIAQRDKKKQIERVIFPRFHQLDVTRKLQAAVLAEGPGGKYLVQHSAGSGKTNSIAWTAHFLADLHDAQDNKVFDTVLVVSDRTVIDSQLSGSAVRFRAPERSGGDDQRQRRQQERRTGGGALRRQEDRGMHDSDLPLCLGSRAQAQRHAGQTLRGHRGRGP